MNTLLNTTARAVFSLTLMIPSFAMADGFVCLSVDEDTRIDVYLSELNPTGPAPKATKVVVSDPNRKPRNRHIATFEADEGSLQTSGSQIQAVVDLSKPGTSRAGERVGGTKLGLLEAIVLEIDVSYQEPIEEGVRYSAEVEYVKRTGEELRQDFDCTLFIGKSPEKVQVF